MFVIVRLLSGGVLADDAYTRELTNSESLVERVKRLLAREATQPLLLSVGGGGQSPALPEYLQLLARTTATLRSVRTPCGGVLCI